MAYFQLSVVKEKAYYFLPRYEYRTNRLPAVTLYLMETNESAIDLPIQHFNNANKNVSRNVFRDLWEKEEL